MMRTLVLLSVLLGLHTSAFAGVVRLAWNYDGAGHLGFRLYYGKASHVSVQEPIAVAPDPNPYESVVDILDPAARGYELSLPEGTYYFRLTTIGVEKDSVFTLEEPVAAIGVNPPEDFTVEWIMLKPNKQER